MPTPAKFLAAERTMLGPPMSMFSMASASVTPALRHGLLEGIEVDHHQVDGLDAQVGDGLQVSWLGCGRPGCRRGWPDAGSSRVRP